MLGQFLAKSGYELKVGNKLSIKDLRKLLFGKKLEFQTNTNENGWPDIIRETIKFID